MLWRRNEDVDVAGDRVRAVCRAKTDLRDGPTRGIEEVAHICFLAQWLEPALKEENPCPS